MYNSLFSFEGQLCTFARLLSLLGRYFHHLKKITMFTVLYRYAHSAQSTETFLYVVGKSKIKITKIGNILEETARNDNSTLHGILGYVYSTEQLT